MSAAPPSMPVLKKASNVRFDWSVSWVGGGAKPMVVLVAVVPVPVTSVGRQRHASPSSKMTTTHSGVMVLILPRRPRYVPGFFTVTGAPMHRPAARPNVCTYDEHMHIAEQPAPHVHTD